MPETRRTRWIRKAFLCVLIVLSVLLSVSPAFATVGTTYLYHWQEAPTAQWIDVSQLNAGNITLAEGEALAHAFKTTGLTAGQTYPVVVEYFENTGFAEAHLLWQTPGSGSFVAIPKAQMSPLTYEYRQSTDGGTTWSAASTAGSQATISEQGETQVQFRATDAAGNVSGWGPTSAG